MEHEESLDVESSFSSPMDWGLPVPMSPLPLLPSSHMNNTDVAQSAQAVEPHQDLELPDITSTPTDVELAEDRAWPPLPSHMKLARAAEAGKKIQQAFELLDFTCNPTDGELVQDYLLPAIQSKKRSVLDFYSGPAVVNPDLPSMDPWELPGMIAHNNKGGMRDKYYLTDHRSLAIFWSPSPHELRTPSGFWKKKTNGIRQICVEHRERFVGAMRTISFQPYREDDALSLTGTKTNWIMNVYYSRAEDSILENGLVLCHVFETDSPDYNNTPKCLGCHPGQCNGNHSGQAFGAPSNASFNSTHPGSRPMHHHDPERRPDPMLNSYIAELANLLLGDPDPDDSTDTGNSGARRGVPPTADHGQSKKRKKSSDVWDYFTKIFARDINGKVLTFAACNHCCKILTGSSTGGTTHLARHTCPCKFKPVAAGRSAKDSGGHVNVLSS